MVDYNVALSDGRTVSVAEYGDPAGRPLVHLHGAASCRFEAEPFDGPAKEHGVRIISVDRPGVGRSTPAQRWTALDYGREVGAIADALRLEEFAVGGVSNGGMYAFAVAHALGERVSKVVPINPATPVGDPGVRARLPLMARLSYAGLARFPKYVARSAARRGVERRGGLAARLNPDHTLMADDATHTLLARIGAEPITQEYLLTEITLATRPWGFDHRAATQRVEFFSGEHDPGRRYAEVWASRLPNATLHLFPGGHLGHLAPAAARAITRRMATP